MHWKKILLVGGILMVALVAGLCVQNEVIKTTPTPTMPADYIRIDYFRGEFSVTQPPIVGRVVDLVFTVHPIIDAPNITVKLILPHGIEALNGNLTWNVDLKKNEKMQFKVPIKVIEEGEWRIQASVVECMPSKECKITRSYYTYIIANKNEAYLSNTSKERKLEQIAEKNNRRLSHK